MRCKNCGTYNDDNRYICETCGSPLYDDEAVTPNPSKISDTQSFNPISDSHHYTGQPAQTEDNHPENEKSENNPAEKKSIIVIAILVVVLVAVIASFSAVAFSKSKNNETSTSIPSTSQTTTRSTTRTTERTTEKTTESTTQQTTTASTTSTTQATIYYINTSSSGGGKVKGNGEYKNGDKVTITATPDKDYVFEGWYSNGVKVSSFEKYSFIANENASFSAVFNPVNNNNDTVSNNTDDINFGD